MAELSLRDDGDHYVDIPDNCHVCMVAAEKGVPRPVGFHGDVCLVTSRAIDDDETETVWEILVSNVEEGRYRKTTVTMHGNRIIQVNGTLSPHEPSPNPDGFVAISRNVTDASDTDVDALIEELVEADDEGTDGAITCHRCKKTYDRGSGAADICHACLVKLYEENDWRVKELEAAGPKQKRLNAMEALMQQWLDHSHPRGSLDRCQTCLNMRSAIEAFFGIVRRPEPPSPQQDSEARRLDFVADEVLNADDEGT